MVEISIVVPCYNQAQYLEECLNSVIRQSFKDWECIIINDGSSDQTHDFAQNWLHKDSRMKYISIDNSGLSEARNTGINYASGKYILPLDADDKIGDEYLEKALNVFNENPETTIVYCYAEFFGSQKGAWKIKDFSQFNLAVQNVIFCSAIFKKDDWKRVDGYDKNLHKGLEDWDFWISILKNNGIVHRIDQVLFYYRKKENSMVTAMNTEYIDYAKEYIVNKHKGFFNLQFGTIHELILEKKNILNELKSRKFAFNLFLRNILGITNSKKFKSFFNTYFKNF